MSRMRTLLVLSLVVSVSSIACGKDPEVAKREFVKSGDAFMAQDRWEEASIQYRNAVAQDPRYAEARLKLAEAAEKTGNFQVLFEQTVRAADLLPDDLDLQIRTGELLLQTRQFTDAQGRADKVLARHPRHVEAMILRANALVGLRRVDEAIVEVEEAILNDPDRTPSYVSLGTMQLIKGDRATAEASYKRAVETDPRSMRAHIAYANYLWAVGRLPEAETTLKAALKIDPTSSGANRMLAYLFMATQRVAEAEAPLKLLAADKKGGEAGPLALADYYVYVGRLPEARSILQTVAASSRQGFITATLRLAALGIMSKDLASADKLLDNILAKGPNAQAFIAKAYIHTISGRSKEAAASLESAVAAEPTNPSAHFQLGRVYAQQRQTDKAIQEMKETLKVNPAHPAAELNLAGLLLSTKKLDDALSFAMSAVGKAPRSASARMVLARVNLARGELAPAEPIVRLLERQLPNEPEVQLTVGALELAKSNYSAALKAFDRVLASSPANLAALQGAAEVGWQTRRREALPAKLDAAVQLAPRDADVLLVAGRVHAWNNSTARAEEYWHRAIEADPDKIAAYSELAGYYLTKRRVPEAIAKFQELLKRQPNLVEAHTILGVLLQSQGRLPEARVHYERALSIDNDAGVAANNLAMLYTESGENPNMAIELAKRAKARIPNRAEVADTLGWAYYKKGMHDMAVAPLAESVKLDATNPTYHYHLGLAHVGTGDRIKARASLAKALEISSTFKGADDARQKLASLN